MAFCRFVLPLLVLSAVNALRSPLYIWGDLPETSFKSGPLETVDTLECSDFLSQELADRPLTLVFIEETLSPEDFSHKISVGKTSFPYLESNVNKAVYLPSVEDPLTALKEVAGEPKSIILTGEDLPKPITEEVTGDFIFIYLKDARDGESRAEFLNRHDDFIQKTVEAVQGGTRDVVAIYTGRYPSWIPAQTHSRVRRAVKANTYTINGLGFNAGGITISSKNETTSLPSVATPSSNFTDNDLNATLVFDNDTTLVLQFSTKGGYWFFDTVILTVGALTETLRPDGEAVYALEGFAYRCSQNVQFSSVNQSRDYTVHFTDLKVQPFFRDTNVTEPFGEAFDCVGFFTAPIWSGLFVVFILLSITFYGIMMMMDIRTMDRFDDPKGKTITINAGE